MIGSRMRQARLAAGLTLDEVAERMTRADQPITKAGISKYEHHKSTPKAGFLLKLAGVLKVKPSYFLEEPAVSVQWLAFRKHPQLAPTRQLQIKAAALNVAEGQVWLQSTLYPDERPRLPEPVNASTAEDAEAAAADLRTRWGLGEAPIESVTQTIEDHGGVVVGWEADVGHFDGLAAWLNETVPLAVTNLRVAADRRRFSLAHELGHLVLRPQSHDDATEESLAHRFAGAFLVPAAVARRELGERRRRVSLEELALLKDRYGLSMQAWTHRALDLGIIEKGQYKSLRAEIDQRGWSIEEPVTCAAPEQPTRLRQMTLRALAEGVITEERALQLCPGCIEPQPLARPEGRRYTAVELMKLPRAERNRILAAAAAEAVEEYRTNPELTEFSILDGEDWEYVDE